MRHHRILGGHFPDAAVLQQYLQEVMFPYRILFGQKRASRERFGKSERDRIFQADSDLFLIDLCCSEDAEKLLRFENDLWPYPLRSLGGSLKELEVFDTSLDFPFLGHRLLEVQAFRLRQQPNRLRDLWRDRRNGLQWYTFWAVILIGGASLLVSLVRCALSAAQVYYAAKSQQQPVQPDSAGLGSRQT